MKAVVAWTFFYGISWEQVSDMLLLIASVPLKVVKREICAVVTKGTLIEGEMLSLTPDAAYLISVTESCKNIENQKEEEVVLGICLVDVSTSRFILGQVYI